MSGAEAVAQGLFSRAMPAAELLENTRAIVAGVATGATGAFRASKELVAHIRDQRLGLWEAMEEENAEQAGCARARTTPRASAPSRRSAARFSRADRRPGGGPRKRISRRTRLCLEAFSFPEPACNVRL